MTIVTQKTTNSIFSISTIFPSKHSISPLVDVYHYVMNVSSNALKLMPSFGELLLVTIVGHVVFIHIL
jgi:hypothetical protein